MTAKRIFEVGEPPASTNKSTYTLNAESIKTAQQVADADGDWVAVLEYPVAARNTAATTAHRIKHGKNAAWRRVGTFDTTVRKTEDGTVRVYARCTSRAQQPTTSGVE